MTREEAHVSVVAAYVGLEELNSTSRVTAACRSPAAWDQSFASSMGPPWGPPPPAGTMIPAGGGAVNS
ncbi:MAG: hypothetical protein M0Z95_07235 [Actinomycetota bacterium]|nr:hypothetical protein [Actinomycetota bacterium]